MRRKNLWIFFLLPFMAGFLIPLKGMAKQVPPGKWWHMPRLAEKLNIREEEKKALDDLYVNSRRAMIDLKASVEKERLELDNLLDREALEESAVMVRFQRLEKARAELSAERFRFLLGVRKILGHDRYQTLKQIFKAFRMKRDRDKKHGNGTDRGKEKTG